MWRGICLIFLSETVLCAVWWLQVWCSHLINRPTHDKTKSPSEGTQKATWTEHVNTMKLVKLFLDGQSNLQACFCLEQVHTRLGRYSCRGILPSLLILRVSSGLPPASLWRVSLDSHCLFLQPWRWRYSWNQKQPLNSGSSTPCLPPKPQKWLAPIQRVWVWGIPDPSGAWPILNPSIALVQNKPWQPWHQSLRKLPIGFLQMLPSAVHPEWHWFAEDLLGWGSHPQQFFKCWSKNKLLAVLYVPWQCSWCFWNVSFFSQNDVVVIIVNYM